MIDVAVTREYELPAVHRLDGVGAHGDGALLMTLAASSSFIAVPAVLRHAVPEANPSVYFGLSLGLNFPLNMTLGIPAWIMLAQRFL